MSKTPVVVEAFDHIVINVRDVEVAAAWYQRVLGMTREDWDAGPGRGRATSMHFGRNKINLRPIAATQKQWFTGRQVAPGSDDLCFLTKAKPREVADHLHACGVDVEVGPTEKRGAMGAIVSVYCRDPDGNLIEVSSYK
jgi:catechol 2,3-dioxygenase-like lactoylglutathione lyase family enzyme